MLARVTICFATLISGTSGILSINLPSPRLLSQTRRASVLRWIDLPSTSFQVPVAWWGDAVQRNRKDAPSLPPLRKRGSEFLAFEIARSPHLVIDALSEYRRLTCTFGALTLKSPRKTLWEKLSAELGHPPYPLTPVLIEKVSAVLKKAGYRSAHLEHLWSPTR